MIEDTMKKPGFGFYPDWRWRCAMKYAPRVECADTPAEYFAGPEEEALLADETLVEFAFPYLRRHLHPGAGGGMPESYMTAMEHALDAANEEHITPNCHSLRLEAGILGRRPAGDLLGRPGELPPLAQTLYERLFFDARPFLDDIAAICRLLFHDKERLRGRGGYDLLCKTTAYGLGFGEYRAWREGSPSGRVKAMQAALGDVFRYMTGLEILGSNGADDMEKGFIRFFAALPGIIARAEGHGGGGRRYHGYTADEMDAVTAMLPRVEPVMR